MLLAPGPQREPNHRRLESECVKGWPDEVELPTPAEMRAMGEVALHGTICCMMRKATPYAVLCYTTQENYNEQSRWLTGPIKGSAVHKILDDARAAVV